MPDFVSELNNMYIGKNVKKKGFICNILCNICNSVYVIFLLTEKCLQHTSLNFHNTCIENVNRCPTHYLLGVKQSDIERNNFFFLYSKINTLCFIEAVKKRLDILLNNTTNTSDR